MTTTLVVRTEVGQGCCCWGEKASLKHRVPSTRMDGVYTYIVRIGEERRCAGTFVCFFFILALHASTRLHASC
ncbi:hypothetical protein BDA96_07G019700 [Sorghum bicolor]|uniref:Uncharacterized protein n=2 Tax=Sorghum bicolor TaxID=4558 RepID=A0A921QHH4_SORBI|nr:hypothetical protein BDA96_07G019700 [Sorghum bicolor]OQU79795.1 hypothetical protein SORBI_3007G018601 [Sorghum bicolor]